MNKYICQLPQATKDRIWIDLWLTGLSVEDINRAMDRKLSDLNDTIDITPYTEVLA